jgi:parvulin-like peptidyl-prolyl isomerase
MGIFERIRQASPWVLTTFAIVFVGFMVLGDMDFSSLQTANNNPENRKIAIVEGEPVPYLEYENNVRNAIAMQRQRNQQAEATGQPAQELDENSIRRAEFSSMVDMTLMKIKAENMGIMSDDRVVAEYMASFPPQPFIQRFSDSTGFRRDVYLRYITNPEGFANDMTSRNPNSTPGQAQQLTNDIRKEIQQYAYYLKDQLYQTSLQVTMQEAGSIISHEFLKNKYIAENSYADFEMIYLKASSIPDSEIEVTDAGLNEFFNKYKESYHQNAQRKIKYASFSLEPSQQDTLNARRKLQKIAKLFNKAKNQKDVEKLFKDASYEYGGTTSEMLPFSQLDTYAQNYLKSASEGDVVGPAVTPDATNYYRVIKIDSGEVSEVKASHILVKFDDNKDSAYNAAMEIYQRLQRGEDFAALATQLSKDPGSARMGGDLGYFGKNKMVKEFEEAAFAADLNEVTKPVESQFGYHLILVTDKVSKKYQVETISIAPTVGSNTRKQLQLKARELSKRVQAGEDFDTVADELGAAKGESAPFFEMQPILGSGYINSFAFANEKGATSKPLDLDNFGITVVQVSEVIPAGIPNLEDVRNDVEFVYKKKLKKDKLKEIAEKMYEAVSKSGNMQDAKAVDSQVQIRTITNTKNNGLISGVQGKESLVTAIVYDQEIGDISRPLRGNTGYFIVKTKSKTIATDELINKNLAEFISKEKTKEQRSGFYQWYQEVRKDADIQDLRADIYTRY